jgi:transposase-like protein
MPARRVRSDSAASMRMPGLRRVVESTLFVRPRTERNWIDRYRREGVEASHRRRVTGKQIARKVGVSPATVRRVLGRLGLSKLSRH